MGVKSNTDYAELIERLMLNFEGRADTLLEDAADAIAKLVEERELALQNREGDYDAGFFDGGKDLTSALLAAETENKRLRKELASARSSVASDTVRGR